jgi:mevalonate kinase
VASVGSTRVGVGRGKLILFGEHAAVYGHPAIGIPLDLETRAELAAAGTGLDGEDAVTVGRILETLGASPGLPVVRLRSTVPRGVGFGSSAALCVALAACLSDAGPPYGPEVWRLAHRAEAVFHGTPSGIDTGLALLEGMHLFRPRPPDLPEHERLPDVTLHLVVGAEPRLSSTGSLVAALRDRMRAGDEQAHRAVRELGRVALLAAESVRRGGDVSRTLGELAGRAQLLLVGLGLSSPGIDSLLARGRALGALGGKLSGAGGGGAFFLVAPTWPAAQRIAAQLGQASPSMRAVLWSDGRCRADPGLTPQGSRVY